MLRHKKLEFPPPQPTTRTPSPQRLMLPPPPPPNTMSRFRLALRNPLFIGTTKILFFCMKAYTLLSPCQPFAADPRVAYPLLAFASIDFVFLGLGITVAGRHVRLDSLSVTVLLLAMHIAVVGMAVRWDGLCARRQVAWAGF
jgi:hypothetical protein